MTDLDKMALLPCPFCGNPDVQLVTLQDADGDTLHAVGCPKCGCNGTPHVAAMDDPRPAAVAAWNRRALLASPPGWKLVPVGSDDGMQWPPTVEQAAARHLRSDWDCTRDDARRVRDAMIAVAPQPKDQTP